MKGLSRHDVGLWILAFSEVLLTKLAGMLMFWISILIKLPFMHLFRIPAPAQQQPAGPASD